MRAPLLVATLALVVAGCGGSTKTESPSAPADSSPPAATAASPAVPAPLAPPADPPALDDDLSVSTRQWKTDFENHTVSLSEISGGGPGKDGIPAIDAPAFDSVEEAGTWLEPREPVVELTVGDDSRAYPLQILIWHEIANDTVGGTPVSITFCPLCNTAIVFDRRFEGQVLDFGTTGNLRNSDLVMYDRQTETWWQQFGGEGIVGELAGKKLTTVPARIVAWEGFAAAHPDGKVLSRDTGHSRPYGQNPYAGYDSIDSPPFFPTANSDDDRLPPKERVVFVERDAEAVAIPFSSLSKLGSITFTLAGEELEAVWTPGTSSALDGSSIADGKDIGSTLVRDVATGDTVVYDEPFWFAVAAFRPDTRIVTGS